MTCSKPFLLLVSGFALVGSPVTSGEYVLLRASIDGGARTEQAAATTLSGTIAQPDVGALQSAAEFTLQGGFHRRVVTQDVGLFVDGFED